MLELSNPTNDEIHDILARADFNDACATEFTQHLRALWNLKVRHGDLDIPDRNISIGWNIDTEGTLTLFVEYQ